MINVFILGSKPDPVFPGVTPDYVYAANGAVALASKFQPHSNLVGVMGRFIFDPNCTYADSTREMLRGIQLDKLVLKGSPAKYKDLHTAKDFHINATKIEYLSKSSINVLRSSARPTYDNLYISAFLCIDPILARFKLNYRRARFKFEFISTGAIALAYALHQHSKEHTMFHVIGIGAKEGSGHFYDLGRPFELHGESDLNFFRSIINGPRNVNFTDPDLISIIR